MSENQNMIRCSYDELVPIEDLKPHPRNPNTHPVEQLNLLAKVISHQGWRAPIVVSRRSGFIVAGHGRLEAAHYMELATVPVNYQNFDSEADELAHLVADNKLPEIAILDSDILKELLLELDTGAFDMDLTGIDELDVDRLIGRSTPGSGTPADEWQGMPEFNNPPKAFKTMQIHFKTPERYQEFSDLIGAKLTDKSKWVWFPPSDQTSNPDSTPVDDL